ncbi:MAG: ribonuclease R [Candidatus Dasytiphilus stammeri]
MTGKGQIIFNRSKRKTSSRVFSTKILVEGKVIGHPHGYGFLRVPGYENDFYLSYEQMKFCIHGDTILAKIIENKYQGRKSACVVKITKPRNNLIIGYYFDNNSGLNFVQPNDDRLNFKIIIPSSKYGKLKTGCIVVVKLVKRQRNNKLVLGKIIEILGKQMSIQIAINMALHTHNIPYKWPEAVKRQIDSIAKNCLSFNGENNSRVDLRNLPFVTIDSEDAQDFDDAVYCEHLEEGKWRLLVAIADVSYYVRPGTALDKEACNRATSIYFPLNSIPMIPKVLSNDLCSLIPNKDRLCLICEMIISRKGTLLSYNHYEAIICSKAQLTYNIVWEILNNNKKLEWKKYQHLLIPLKNLYEMYHVLIYASKQRGCLSFNIQEAKFILNSKQRIDRIEPIIRNDAHKIIEECMILANIASADLVQKYQEPSLFRDHDRPNHPNLIRFTYFLQKKGLFLRGGKKPQSKDYSDLLIHVMNRPDREILQKIMLRSMPQAVYAAENRGHFGLALSRYTHFTSPIRRYPDLLLHRVIKYILYKRRGIHNNNTYYHYSNEQMRELGKHCSLAERRADEAVRNVHDWLKCEFMKDKIGKIYIGNIALITSLGLVVKFKENCIEGLVHISTLKDDKYKFDPVTQKLIGHLKGNSYCIYDTVNVKVLAVNIERRRIDLILTKN